MNTPDFRKRNVVVLIVTALIVSVGVSTSITEYIQYAGAQTKSNSTTGMTGGNNSHAVSARLAVLHGFLVYRALVVDSNYDLHTVLVDAGNGNVLSSAPLSIANNGMMSGSTQSFSSRPGSASSDTGITSGHASNTTPSVNKGSSNTLGIKGPTQSFSSRPPSLVR